MIPPGQPDDSALGETSSDDARFAITQFSFWINNADAKAGLLATAVALLVVSVVSQKSSIVELFPLTTATHRISFISLCLASLLLTFSVGALFLTLKPRRMHSEFSRYSWVAVSKETPKSMLTRARFETERADAWETAIVLAKIVERKVRTLAFAASCWLAATIFVLLWYALLPP